MATKRQRRRRRRLILLAIVLAFIFIPERTVDEVTEAPVNLVEEALQEAPVSSEIVSEYEKAKKEQDSLAGTAANTGSTSTKQKAQKSSSSPSQQYAGSSENKYYTKDRNGLYDFAGFVLDAANLLTTAQYNELTAFLNNLDDTTGVQIAVLTVPSLNGVALEEFSIRHAEKWQLGQKGVDNGALLVASMEEHALRIDQEGVPVRALALAFILVQNVLEDVAQSDIVAAILVPHDVAAPFRSLCQIIRVALLIQRKVAPSGHFVAHYLQVGELVDGVFEFLGFLGAAAQRGRSRCDDDHFNDYFHMN